MLVDSQVLTNTRKMRCVLPSVLSSCPKESPSRNSGIRLANQSSHSSFAFAFLYPYLITICSILFSPSQAAQIALDTLLNSLSKGGAFPDSYSSYPHDTDTETQGYDSMQNSFMSETGQSNGHGNGNEDRYGSGYGGYSYAR